MSADEQQHTTGVVAGYPRRIGAGESRSAVETWVWAARAAALLRGALARAGVHRGGAVVISAEAIDGRPVVRVRVTGRADDVVRLARRATRVRSWPVGVSMVVQTDQPAAGHIG
jgi:hypothetical protein